MLMKCPVQFVWVLLIRLGAPCLVTVRGSQGHAGTVPMSMGMDPMAAAAELIVSLESLCKHPRDFLFVGSDFDEYALDSLSTSFVCKVGEISTWPGASNIIPGQARNAVEQDTKRWLCLI